MTIFFLTLKEVLEIHKDEIQHYGGAFGVRDKELLISALAQPCASFSGQEALNFKIKKKKLIG